MTLAAEENFALQVRQLTAVLGGRKVIDIPSLHVRRNETLVIIGPNGSGKTTLLLCLATLLKPEKGTVSYTGAMEGMTILQLRRRLAVVFQEPLLLDATAWSNVTMGLKLRGVKRAERDRRGQEWLRRLGIEDLAGRQARTLSAGEAQRASLARAMALQPEVLFLDEPFGALDFPSRQALIGDLGRILRETGTTTVMVTHDRDEALTLADRVGVLINGGLRQVGSPRDVFSSPVDEEVAGFVGVENVLPGAVVSTENGIASVDIEGQHLDVVSNLPAGSRVTACLRPEDVTVAVSAPGVAMSSARNRLSGRVARVFPAGSQVRVTVDCGVPLVALITRRSYEDMGLSVGQNVLVFFKASAVHLIQKGLPAPKVAG